jgi:hypothetical protein
MVSYRRAYAVWVSLYALIIKYTVFGLLCSPRYNNITSTSTALSEKPYRYIQHKPTMFFCCTFREYNNIRLKIIKLVYLDCIENSTQVLVDLAEIELSL